MKRSKIFLALTTCCLAVAGVFAAKATHFGTSPGFYLTATFKQKCLPLTHSKCLYDATATPTCLTVIGGITYKLYITSTCVKPLTYNVD